MKTFAPIVTAMLFAANTVAIDPLVVHDVANATACETLTFSWSGGTPPYELNIIMLFQGSDIPPTAIEQLANQTGTSLNWVANIIPPEAPLAIAGEAFTLNIVDAAGDAANSSVFGIKDTDKSCLTPLVLNTPSTGTVCETLTLSWSGGTPPYSVSIAQLLPDSGAFSGIFTFPTPTTTSIDWLVDIIPNTKGNTFTVEVVDGLGNADRQTANFKINDSANHTCLTSNPRVSPTGSSPTSTATMSASESKSSTLSVGKIVGIGLGLLAALLILAAWRVYTLRTRRRRWTNLEDPENLGLGQKIPLTPIQKKNVE